MKKIYSDGTKCWEGFREALSHYSRGGVFNDIVTQNEF